LEFEEEALRERAAYLLARALADSPRRFRMGFAPPKVCRVGACPSWSVASN